MDWTDVLAIEDENPRARLAAELLASNAYGSTAERVKAFVERQGGVPGDVLQLPAEAGRWERHQRGSQPVSRRLQLENA